MKRLRYTLSDSGTMVPRYIIKTPHGHVTRYSAEHRCVVVAGPAVPPRLFTNEDAHRFMAAYGHAPLGLEPGTARVVPA